MISKQYTLGIDIPETQFFEHRTIGQQVRHARMFGVTPDMVVTESAYDDDVDDAVDPFGNPRTDRIDLIRDGLLSASSAPTAINASDQITPSDVQPTETAD